MTDGLDKALAGWKQFNGDQPSRDALVSAIDKLIETRVLAMCITTPPFICADALTDEDYEALLRPGKPFQYTRVNPETVFMNGPVMQYVGPQRPTCATCGALMVDGLCSADGAHYQ